MVSREQRNHSTLGVALSGLRVMTLNRGCDYGVIGFIMFRQTWWLWPVRTCKDLVQELAQNRGSNPEVSMSSRVGIR